MKDKIEKLMSISEEGQKFTSKELIKYLSLPDSNQSYKILALLMKEFDCFAKTQITYYKNGNRHCVKGYKLVSNPCTVEVIEEDEEDDNITSQNILTRELIDIVTYMKNLYFYTDTDDLDAVYFLKYAKYDFKSDYEQLQKLIQ